MDFEIRLKHTVEGEPILMTAKEKRTLQKFVDRHKLIQDYRFLDVFKKAAVITPNRRISQPRFVLEISYDD